MEKLAPMPAKALDFVLQYAPSAATLKQFGEDSPQWQDAMMVFQRVLYATRFMAPFDWMKAFSGEKREQMQDASLLDTADGEQVRKLLIAHVRADRFCHGHLNAIIRDGYLERALNRLRVLSTSP